MIYIDIKKVGARSRSPQLCVVGHSFGPSALTGSWLARYDDVYLARREMIAQGRGVVRQGAGRPSTGITGGTMKDRVSSGLRNFQSRRRYMW